MATPTPQQVREMCTSRVTVDLRSVLRAAGIGEANGYELARRGELPFPVLRVGRVYKVPTSGLLAALGLSPIDASERQLTA